MLDRHMRARVRQRVVEAELIGLLLWALGHHGEFQQKGVMGWCGGLGIQK